MKIWDWVWKIGSKFPVYAEKVKFSYADEEVLKDVTLNVREGTITAIIGKSGSGKSTFLKLVAGIIAQSHQGKIKIYGKPKVIEKKSIGFVPQELALIPDLSILDNIKIAGLGLGLSEKLAQKKAKELMNQLKLDVRLSKKPTELSGGQKVRLNIVLSLLHKPKIIILDEPFVGLDFMNRMLLWHFLEKMRKRGLAIILTSHLLTETQSHVDKLVILKGGKVFFRGKMEGLMKELQIRFVFEARIPRLTKADFEKIKKYCDFRDIKILDHYEKYLMFSIKSPRTRDALMAQFRKQRLEYEVISFREPNLDEIFLKT
jgi:ABC-2 type transport system ATP-binding protein